MPDQVHRPTSTPDSPSPSVGSNNLRLIGERVATLLGHFWTPADSPELRSLVAGDWLNDLREFPAATVAEACQMWRRTETRKPTIADIRKLCIEVQPKPPQRLALPRATSEYDRFATDRRHELETAEQARQRFAEEHGCADFAEVMKRGIQNVGRGNGKLSDRAPVVAPLGTADILRQARKRMGISDPEKSSEVA